MTFEATLSLPFIFIFVHTLNQEISCGMSLKNTRPFYCRSWWRISSCPRFHSAVTNIPELPQKAARHFFLRRLLCQHQLIFRPKGLQNCTCVLRFLHSEKWAPDTETKIWVSLVLYFSHLSQVNLQRFLLSELRKKRGAGLKMTQKSFFCENCRGDWVQEPGLRSDYMIPVLPLS